MSPHAYLVAVTIGAALTGLWLAVRLDRFAPQGALGAGGCFLAALIVPSLGRPALEISLSRLPVGMAVLVSIFPVFMVTFGLIALGLRWLVGLAGHAIR